MTRAVRFILRHRAAVLAAIVLLVAAALYSSRRIRLQFQFRDFYDYAGNPDRNDFKRANEDFGDPAGNVVVLVRAKDVFQPEVLTYIKRLTEALEPNPLFVHIHSLSNARSLRGEGDSVFSGPVLTRLPDSPAAVEAARKTVLADPLLVRRLVSPDSAASAVLAEMRTPAAFSSVDEQGRALAAVRQTLLQVPPTTGIEAIVTGAPTVEVETTRTLIVDQVYLMPGVMLVLIIALFLTFRSKHGILLALASVTVATVWTAGVFSCLGRPVDMIGSIIPTCILVYGVVDPIFVLTRFLQKLDAGRSQEDAIVESLSELALPCFLTSLTTALGFLAFVTAPAPTIQYFGLTVGIGVLLSWVTTVTLLPILLSLVAPPRRRFAALGATRRIDRALHVTWTFTRSHARLVMLATGVLLIAGGFAARRQRILNTYIGSLPHGLVQDQVRLLERDMTGVIRFVVYLEGEPESMRRPEVLAAIARIDAAMKADPLVTYSVSLADIVASANQAFSGGASTERRIPSSRALVAQYLALMDPQDRSRVVSDDYARTQIAFLVRDRGSEGARGVASTLERAVAASGIRGLGVRAVLTGNGVVAYRQLDHVVVELVKGFAVAFLIVVVVQWLMFRSLRIALISVVPNLVPVVLCFLALRVLQLALRIDSALVLCVSIGGLFNTTIHLAARIRQLTRTQANPEPDAIVEQTLRAIGPAALFTSGVLSAGFSVLMLSSFAGLRALGLLSMVTLLSAVACDILISPVLFRFFYKWDAPPPREPVAAAFSPG
jgi:predicted RND superfamily exporter protein